MSKNDKKIISFVLIFLMLLSTFAPIVNAATAEDVAIADSALKASLLKLYDSDKNGKLSKEELMDIYSLTIPEETKTLKGLEEAENIEDIDYTYNGTLLDFSPINQKIKHIVLWLGTKEVKDLTFLKEFKNLYYITIKGETQKIDVLPLADLKELSILEFNGKMEIANLGKLVNIERLRFHYRMENEEAKSTFDMNQIKELSKLTELGIDDAQIKNANVMANYKKLRDLFLTDCTGISDLSFLKNNTELINIQLDNSDISNIDFMKNLPKLNWVNLYGTKLTDKDKAALVQPIPYTAYLGEKFYVASSASKISGVFNSSEWNYASNNTQVATVEEGGKVTTLKNGEATITLTHKKDNSITKTMKVTVTGISANQAKGSDMGTTTIAEDIILKANGELWKVYAKEGKAEKLDSNVKKFVYEFVYTKENEAFNYTLTQKKDGTVEYVFNGVKSILKDAKDIYNNGYLATDGTYYTITEEGTWKKTTDNVEKIVGSYLVKKDGKTYTVTNALACNFKIKDACNVTVVDENNNVWYLGTVPATKIGTNFKEFLYKSNMYLVCPHYRTTDGKIKDGTTGKDAETLYTLYGNEIVIDINHNLTLNGTLVLTDVASIDYITEKNTEEYARDYLITRTDGSMWIFSLEGRASLKKVVEQASSIYFAPNGLETKDLALSNDILVGFDPKNLEVKTALASSKFNGYTAKAFKGETELTGDKKVGTGTIVKLYKDGKVVAEYTALVYGDVTGSGSPSSKDALAIIKNRLGKVIIEDKLLLEAGRVTENSRKTGAVPSSADALAIIKTKLNK